jgi:hypothetical protein
MNLVNATISSEGLLNISPAPGSSKNDFDFFIGEWKITNRKLKTRLNSCTEWDSFNATQETRKILIGLGNTDIFYSTVNGNPFEGLTLRLFNPKTKLWNLYWVDSNEGRMDPPLIGSFENSFGTFYCADKFNDQKILVMFQWDKTNAEKPVWSQAFSIDNGKTWEWNWYMYFEK